MAHVLPTPVMEPEEITTPIMFLIGPEARCIGGAVIDVSAGAGARQLG
jgi:hypothetical protein